MTPYLFKFYLLNNLGQYYYVDASGNVSLSNEKRAILDTPEGWEDMRIKLGRHSKYYGIVTSITTPLNFRGDGAKILKSLYYRNGQAEFEAYCQCIIEKRIDGGVNIWGYEPYGVFLIDFANELNDMPEEEGGYFTVKLFEENVMTQIDAKSDVDFELQFTDNIPIQYNGVIISQIYRYFTSGVDGIEIDTPGAGDDPPSQRFVFPMALANDEIINYFRYLHKAQSQNFLLYQRNDETPGDDYRFFATEINGQDGVCTFTGTIIASTIPPNVGGDGTFELRLVEKDYQNNYNETLIDSQLLEANQGNQNFTYNVTFNKTFDAGRSYYLVLRGNIDQATVIESMETDFTLSFAEALPSTTAPSLKYRDFADELIGVMTDGEGVRTTDFLDLWMPLAELYKQYGNIPFYTHVNSDTALRNLEGASMKTTFNDMFQDMQSRWMVGMDVTGNNIAFQQLPFFFKKDVEIITINEISSFSKKTAVEWIYNKIKAGYPDQTLDRVNGRFEINSEQQWKLFFKRAVNELDIQSPYSASVYEIEYNRGDYDGKETTNTEGGNQIFLTEVSGAFIDGNVQLLKYDTPPDSVSGVFSPATHYNWGLTPETFILRWMPYFKSLLNIPDDEFSGLRVEFVSGKKNTSYGKYINGYAINGGTDLLPSTPQRWENPDKLFVPLVFEFECEQPNNIYAAIKANRYGVIRFQTGVGYAEGFILDAEINPSTKDRCKFTLLCSPNTDTSIFA